MNKNGNAVLWAVLAVVGAVLALGAGVGVKYVLTPKQPVQEVSAPTPPAPAPQVAADETANWKTYKNEKYGFEFKYPQDWSTQFFNYQPATDLPFPPIFLPKESAEYAFSIATPGKEDNDFLLIVGGANTTSTGMLQPERPVNSFDMIIGKIGQYKNSSDILNQFKAWEEENKKETARLSSYAPDDERRAEGHFEPTATIAGKVSTYDSVVYIMNVFDPTSAASWFYRANIFHNNLILEVQSRYHSNAEDIQLFQKVLATLKFF